MNRSLIDLHCHSTASDGDLSPTDLIDRAHENGVKVISLTDHDTVAGLNEADLRAKQHGMNLIPGIELSCTWRAYTIHILGLNFSLDHSVMLEAEKKQTQARMDRASCINERLVKKGLPDLLELAIDNAESGIPGRPHFAQAMIKEGLVGNFSEAFKKYLGAGKTGDVKGFWPELEEVLNWVRLSDGNAVIAHPRKYNMTLTRLRELITDFKSGGGSGLEVVVAGQKQGEIGLLSDLCARYGLKASVGSDFHSKKFPWSDLGRIPGLPKTAEPIWADWGIENYLDQ